MREARGLTIDEISKQTNISQKYIHALEGSNWKVLPPRIYIKGFVKSYGELLGADISDLYARFDESYPDETGSINKFEIPTPITGKRGKKETKFIFSDIPKGLFFLIIVVFVGVLAVVYALNKDKQPGTELTPALGFETDQGTSKWDISLEDEEIMQSVEIGMDEINAAWALGRADSLTLTIEARDKSWLLVETDYKRAFKGTMYESQTKTWRAKNSFFLTLGRPSTVKLDVNGFDLKPFKATGFPMDVKINRANVLDLLEGHEKLHLPSLPDSSRIIDSSKLRESLDSGALATPVEEETTADSIDE